MKFPPMIPPSKYPTVFFGRYVIPNTCKPNRTFVVHPIEWLVLEQDAEKGRALLLSRHALDWESFGYETTSWEVSDLRAWLGGEFFRESFSEEEQGQILPVSDNAVDKVFLLSVDEVRKYFPDGESAVAYEPMVDAFGVSGSKEKPIEIFMESTLWWTRSSGSGTHLVQCVDLSGGLYEMDCNCDEIGVRPAMWVKL